MQIEHSAETSREGSRSWATDWLCLVKFPIALMNGLAAVAGYLVSRPQIEPRVMLAAAAVVTLACGAAALNNYQDRRMDSRFPRTWGRPLPRKSIAAGHALLASLILIGCGLLGLALTGASILPACVGLVAVFLYNGVYTPLKSKTVWAMVPGTACGMVPPLIGWMAAGGDVRTGPILVLMIILGVWQLPHYWLVLLSHPTSRQTADLPNMLRLFSVRQIRRMLLVWVTAFSCITMFLPVARVVYNPWLNGLVVVYLAVMSLFFVGAVAFRTSKRSTFAFLSKYLNSSMAMIMLAVVVDRLILLSDLRVL